MLIGTKPIGPGTITISSIHRPPASLSRSLFWCLPLASNSKSFTSLCNRSRSSSLSSNCLCPKASDTVWFVWYDPSPRPDCSSSCSRSLSSRLFCLHSRHMDPRDDPIEPLLAEPSDCLSNIFYSRVSTEPQLCRRSPQTTPIVCTPNKLNGSTRSWAHNIFLTWALNFLLWVILA